MRGKLGARKRSFMDRPANPTQINCIFSRNIYYSYYHLFSNFGFTILQFFHFSDFPILKLSIFNFFTFRIFQFWSYQFSIFSLFGFSNFEVINFQFFQFLDFPILGLPFFDFYDFWIYHCLIFSIFGFIRIMVPIAAVKFSDTLYMPFHMYIWICMPTLTQHLRSTEQNPSLILKTHLGVAQNYPKLKTAIVYSNIPRR